MKKTLIVFFSMTGESYVSGKLINLKKGNIHVAVDMIAKMIDADQFQIKTVQEYPQGHMNLINFAKEELNYHARPKLTDQVTDMEQYDTVILGYPNWWETCPMPIFTFLESYDFTDKRILPLCSHEGSGISNSVEDIQKICPQARVENPLAIVGGKVKNSYHVIENWLKTNKLL